MARCATEGSGPLCRVPGTPLVLFFGELGLRPLSWALPLGLSLFQAGGWTGGGGGPSSSPPVFLPPRSRRLLLLLSAPRFQGEGAHLPGDGVLQAMLRASVSAAGHRESCWVLTQVPHQQ